MTDSLGVVIAGGSSTRMGRDKASLILAGRPLALHALDGLRPQVRTLALNVNGTPPVTDPDIAILADDGTIPLGPLAGVLAAIRHAIALGLPQAVTAAVDTPFMPADLVSRLMAANGGGPAVAASLGALHPVFSLWPTSLKEDLARFLETDPKRRVHAFLDRHGAVIVDFPALQTPAGPVDPFFNINTPEDFGQAERILAGRKTDGP